MRAVKVILLQPPNMQWPDVAAFEVRRLCPHAIGHVSLPICPESPNIPVGKSRKCMNGRGRVDGFEGMQLVFGLQDAE